MRHRLLVLVVISSVLLAGCAGIQGTETPTGESPTSATPADSATEFEPGDIAGISNDTLTNATALVTANGAIIVQNGARVSIEQRGPNVETESLLTVGADGTSELSTTYTASSNQAETSDYYNNGSATYIRMQSDTETMYRVFEQEYNPLDSVNSSLETALAAGSFTVANESTNASTVVLTADEFSTGEHGSVISDGTVSNARLVLSQNGQIQNLTITGQRDGQTVTYTYELQEANVANAASPAWITDVPPSASLHPELSTNVENDSYLRIAHEGGDTVPENATLTLSANGTSGTVAFDSPLESGETRYAYFGTDNDSLMLAAEQPSPDVTAPMESPASVTIATADGVTLLDVGMAWGSESSSESTQSGSGSSSDQQ